MIYLHYCFGRGLEDHYVCNQQSDVLCNTWLQNASYYNKNSKGLDIEFWDNPTFLISNIRAKPISWHKLCSVTKIRYEPLIRNSYLENLQYQVLSKIQQKFCSYNDHHPKQENKGNLLLEKIQMQQN